MDVLRYAAFTTDPRGGNPAGVVLDATGATDVEMQRVAAEVGYSETAFLFPRPAENGVVDVRYFSPLAEVPFCGHATIATSVAHAARHGTGTLLFNTRSGPVQVQSRRDANDRLVATLVSVPPRSKELTRQDLELLLTALRWDAADLDKRIPPRVAYAGAWHPIIAAASRGRLARLEYDFEALSALMAARDWTTIALVQRASPTVFHARNPFPPGGVREDPATGAAAAAFGGYLREFGLIDLPGTVTINQGADMGRPGTLVVGIPVEPDLGISVSGSAVNLA